MKTRKKQKNRDLSNDRKTNRRKLREKRRKRQTGKNKGRLLKSVRLFRTLASEFGEVKLLVDGKWKKFDIRSEFCLTPDAIKSRFYTEAEQQMFFSTLLANARVKERKAADELDRLRSYNECTMRDAAEQKGEPRSDWYFKSLIDGLTEIVNAKKELRKWEKQVDLLEAINSGLRTLRQMTLEASQDRRQKNKYLGTEGED